MHFPVISFICLFTDCIGFPCDDGGCTTFSIARCDGTKDCTDGSDETNCGKMHAETTFNTACGILSTEKLPPSTIAVSKPSSILSKSL